MLLAVFSIFFVPLAVFAQDGGITVLTTSAEAAGYSCDSTQCRLPHCNCASTSPPGGLSPVSIKSARHLKLLSSLAFSTNAVTGAGINIIQRISGRYLDA